MQQERILLDASLPFRAVVESRLAQTGLMYDAATSTLNPNPAAPPPSESVHGPAPTNLEELVGWPKEIIRARRAEILVELVIDPPDRVLHMLRFRHLKQRNGQEDDDFDYGRKPSFKIRFRAGDHMDESEDDEYGKVRRMLTPEDLQRFARMVRLKEVRILLMWRLELTVCRP